MLSLALSLCSHNPALAFGLGFLLLFALCAVSLRGAR